jgi:hypothetical protein
VILTIGLSVYRYAHSGRDGLLTHNQELQQGGIRKFEYRGVGSEKQRPAAPKGGQRAQNAESTPKGQDTEQLALTISIASSIISAVAAVLQTWLTHRANRANR